jgi:hypothetical protein
MMTTRRLFTFGLFGAVLRAQPAKPDFSGTWELDPDRTEGPFTPPAMTQTVDHKDPVFKWTTKFKDEGTPKVPMFLTGFAVPSGEVKSDAHYETVKLQAGERETRTMWTGQKMVTTWTIRTLHDPSQGKWQRSLSEDGKTQTVDIEFRSTMMGVVQAKLVFVKR